jgi:REP element-mobilizing transposase RayT
MELMVCFSLSPTRLLGLEDLQSPVGEHQGQEHQGQSLTIDRWPLVCWQSPMSRKVRVEFEGAVYHVMARGNERKPTFRDDRDRERFWDALREATERFGLLVHAYCLMPNHYHLVIETLRANLNQAMGWLQTTYTMRFNRRHRRAGHLFQGRYKAQLVDAVEYGQWLVRYVH